MNVSGKSTENGSTITETSEEKEKSILKLVMNPHGKVQDINSLRKQGHCIEPALSPDVCLEIVRDLNSPKGKGRHFIRYILPSVLLYSL